MVSGERRLRVECPRCGIVDLPAHQATVVVAERGVVLSYRCAGCDEPRLRELDGRAAELVRAVGVESVIGIPSREGEASHVNHETPEH